MQPARCIAAAAAVVMALLSLSVGGGVASASGEAATHWGSFFGGDGAADTLLSPTEIVLPGRVVQVASSNSTQYALLADGSVYAWGLGGDGQLGDGGTADSLTVALPVRFPTGVKIAALPTDVMPYNTGLAVDTAGHAWGWGFDSAGQLCLGNLKEHLTPVKLPFSGVTALAGAGDHALYAAGGRVYGCGGNHNGDLGDGSSTPSDTRQVVRGLQGRPIRALVAAFNNSGALLDSGKYLDWGYDGQGQLGDGTIGVNSDVPVTVKLPHPVTQVAQGGSYTGNGQTLVMLSDGSLRSWGADQQGQLGDRARVAQPSPIAFAPPAGVTYAILATGAVTSYAVSTTGDVYSWGAGVLGQIGNGGTSTELDPMLVVSGVSLISVTANNVVTG